MRREKQAEMRVTQSMFAYEYVRKMRERQTRRVAYKACISAHLPGINKDGKDFPLFFFPAAWIKYSLM